MKADPKQIPITSSAPEVWIEWHKALKSNFGKSTANQIFLKAWALRGHNSDDANLRSYLKDQGISLTTGVLGKTEDYASGVLDSIGDVFSVGKYLGLGIIVIGTGLAAIFIFNIAKDPVKSASAAAKFA